jgi:hypothetical protein
MSVKCHKQAEIQLLMLVIHRILNKKLLLIRSKNLAHPIGSNLIRLLRDITGEKKIK